MKQIRHTILVFIIIISALGSAVALKLSKDGMKEPQFLALVTQTVKQYNRMHKKLTWYESEEVYKAYKFAGKDTFYEFRIRLKPTNCSENHVNFPEDSDERHCPDLKNVAKVVCDVRAFPRSWTSPSAVIHIRNCWLHMQHVLDMEVSQWHRPIDNLISRTKAYHSAIRTAQTMVLDRSTIPLGLNHTLRAYLIEQSPMEKSILLTFTWDGNECQDFKVNSSDECHRILGKNNRLTCGAQFPWPYHNESTGIQMLNCTLVHHDDPEMSKFYFHGLNLSAPQNYKKNGWTKTILDWSTRIISGTGQFTDDLQKRVVALYKQQYNYYDRDYRRLLLQAIVNEPVTQMHEPSESLRFRVLMQGKDCLYPHYSDYDCNMERICTVLIDKRRNTTALIDCQRVRNAPVYKLQSSHLSSPWFLQALEFVVDKFNAITPLSTIFRLQSFEEARWTSPAYNAVQLLVTLNAETCLAVGLLSLELCQTTGENLELVRCNVTVSNSTDAQLTLPVIEFNDCWHIVRLSDKVISRWMELNDEQMSTNEWKSITQQSRLAFNKHFENAFEMTDLAVKNAFLRVDGQQMISFRLHVTIRHPIPTTHICQVLVSKVPPIQSDITIYGCGEGLLPTNDTGLESLTLMTEEEKNLSNFTTLVEIAVTKINEMYGGDGKKYVATQIKPATIKFNNSIEIRFQMVLQRTCSKNYDSGLQLAEPCMLFDFSYAIVCEVSSQTRNWFGLFREANVTSCQRVQPAPVSMKATTKRYGHIHENEFQALTVQIMGIFHEKYPNETLYSVFMVENFTETLVAGGWKQSFQVTLRPTVMKKTNNGLFLADPMWNTCSEWKNQYVLHCRVTREEMRQRPKEVYVRLDACDKVRAVQLSGEPIFTCNSSAATTPSDVIRNLANQAMNVFENDTWPHQKYNLLNVDSITHNFVAGPLLSFRIIMSPENTARPYKSAVMCEVRIWTRPWLRNRRSFEVYNCHSIYEEMETATTIQNVINYWKLREHIRELYIPHLTQLIVHRLKVTSHEHFTVKDVAIQSSGNVFADRHEITMYLQSRKPNKNASSAMESDSFYECKCSIWELSSVLGSYITIRSCDKISSLRIEPHETIPKMCSVNSTKIYMAEMLINARNYFNFLIGPKDFDYTLVNTSEVVQEISLGLKTTLNIHLRPASCQKPHPNLRCTNHSSSHEVVCRVYVWDMPWFSLGPQTLIHTCRKVFDSINVSSIVISEEGSITNKSNLWIRTNFEIKRIDDVIQQQQDGRNVTLNITFSPVACMNNFTLKTDMSCFHWQVKNLVRCKFSFYESSILTQKEIIQLNDCEIVKNDPSSASWTAITTNESDVLPLVSASVERNSTKSNPVVTEITVIQL